MTATHTVDNQAAPYVGVNLYAAHRPLRDALAAFAPEVPTARLAALGAAAGSAEWQDHARLANAHRPVLHTHDRAGRRVDVVEFHASYHALLGHALRHGLHGAPWTRGPLAHVERAAGFMLFTEAEPGVLCPVSMSYAAVAALRTQPELHAFVAGLAHADYGARDVPAAAKSALTVGMGMTEKQGGSDVRANTTRAEYDGDDTWGRRYAVTGHKWFFSAPMSDAHLILAQTPGGLSCLLLPRWRPDGTRNAVAIQRLKDKLGNHANASAEVEFDRATAWLVGDEGRGIAQILEMGSLTRLDCALGTAGSMRQALGLAVHHARQRRAFGRALVDQHLMTHVLADLAVDSEAATLLALRLALAVDRSEHGGADAERVLRRVLTPVAKFWVCKRGAAFAQEAMECLGGNGYVEDGGAGVAARIYREMPVNSIWEGAGNIMALDLLRALRGADVVPALADELRAARGAHRAFDAAADALLARIASADTDAAVARRLARDTAVVWQAALLHRASTPAVFAAFCGSRLAQASDAYGLLGAGVDHRAIVDRALAADAVAAA